MHNMIFTQLKDMISLDSIDFDTSKTMQANGY